MAKNNATLGWTGFGPGRAGYIVKRKQNRKRNGSNINDHADGGVSCGSSGNAGDSNSTTDHIYHSLPSINFTRYIDCGYKMFVRNHNSGVLKT